MTDRTYGNYIAAQTCHDMPAAQLLESTRFVGSPIYPIDIVRRSQMPLPIGVFAIHALRR